MLSSLALLLHQEGALTEGQGVCRGRTKPRLPIPHHHLGIPAQIPPAFQTHPLALQRYQESRNFCKEFLELGFRVCSATCSHHARSEKHQQLPKTRVIWAQERSGRCQPCPAQAVSLLRSGPHTRALPAPSLNHSSASFNHLVCAFDHPVEMISAPLKPPPPRAAGAASASKSPLPALLGIHQKRTFQGAETALPVTEALAAARAPATPPRLPVRGGCGTDHRCCCWMCLAGRARLP